MSHSASFPSRATCTVVDARSTLRRSAAQATTRFARFTTAHRRRPQDDVLTTSAVLDPAFSVTVDRFGRSLRVSGEFDVAAVDRFAGAASALAVERGGDVVVDLADLRFIDAAGLGALVVLRNAVAAAGHRLVLRDVPATAARIFRAGGLSALLPVAA